LANVVTCGSPAEPAASPSDFDDFAGAAPHPVRSTAAAMEQTVPVSTAPGAEGRDALGI
jgi:hypothetical protein